MDKIIAIIDMNCRVVQKFRLNIHVIVMTDNIMSDSHLGENIN